METKTAMIRARMEPKLKQTAEAIFSQLGLSTTDAITMFYRQVVMQEGLPLSLKVPNKETRKAMEEVRAGKNLIKSNLEELRRKFP